MFIIHQIEQAIIYLKQIRHHGFKNTHSGFIFIHINKTAGLSIAQALDVNKHKRHLTAREIKNKIGNISFKRKFLFSFVRNPWDRVVSQYHHRVRTDQSRLKECPLNFKEWLIRAYKNKDKNFINDRRMFMPQYDWLCDENDKIAVHFIGRFEHLHDDFEKLCRKLNINKKLPHLNKTVHRHYKEHYNAETKKIIEQQFEKDIDYFKYSF